MNSTKKRIFAVNKKTKKRTKYYKNNPNLLAFWLTTL